LNSVITQTLKEIEIICINDGSTDNSLDILKEYAKKDGRIRIYSQHNRGQGTVRNRGIDLAKGEYVYFIDSDNFVKSNSRLYYLLGTKNVRVKDTTKLKINGNGFQSPNGNSLILFQANTKTYEEIRALIQFRMINCQNKEIIEELKNILSDKNLDEKHLYEKLKEENSLENLINEFQLFLLKNILLNIIFNQTKK
jgi:hypothetical protein